MSARAYGGHGNVAGGLVTISGDSVTHAYTEPVHISGQVIYTDNTSNIDGRIVFRDNTLSAERGFVTFSSGQQLFSISGSSIQEIAIYRRSDYIGESLPNIWCSKCFAGLHQSLCYGRIWADRGKIWAECFDCWRKRHERN